MNVFVPILLLKIESQERGERQKQNKKQEEPKKKSCKRELDVQSHFQSVYRLMFLPDESPGVPE